MRTILFGSLSESVRAGTASLAFGPKLPRDRVAQYRMLGSSSLRLSIRLGTECSFGLSPCEPAFRKAAEMRPRTRMSAAAVHATVRGRGHVAAAAGAGTGLGWRGDGGGLAAPGSGASLSRAAGAAPDFKVDFSSFAARGGTVDLRGL